MSLVMQRSIWNPSYSFGYPTLTTNQVGNDIGIAMGWGGNAHYWANVAVGDLTQSPFVVWNVTSSNTSCQCGRWGDYMAIRPDYGYNRAGFTASGYGTMQRNSPSGGYIYDNHFVRFSVTS
jgi:hypothetical protein